MDSPMPVTTLCPTLTLLAHQLSPTPCPLSPILVTQVFMVILMPTVAFMATPDARSVMPRPPLRLTPRPRLPLMPGTVTTDTAMEAMVDTMAVDMEAMEATMAVDMEAMEATMAVDMEAMEDTDGANRPNQLHPRPTHPIINQTRPT